MHLSRLKIKNYRSIKTLDLVFCKGKNVIVGKNNAGKSNIIKAINLMLGENSPSYSKSENITENDFHGGNKTDNILIFCELTRDRDEPLGYDEIYKCYGYKFHAENTRSVNPVRYSFRESIDDFWTDFSSAMDIVDDEVHTTYVNPKLRNQSTFEAQLDNKYCFALGFRASFAEGRGILKELRFFYREDVTQGWTMCFTAPVRTELLQSAIIPSFRDPSNELRINQWSWFGKLLRSYINTEDGALQAAFGQLRVASDGVFLELQEHVNSSNIKVAFPETTISFQFNPETRVDVYKGTLIYVDDGFNSLLQDKGSGIQSAVIIGLFHYYTRNISHTGSSLLAIEEPEVYLHPQARRVVSKRLDDFLEEGKNQVILTTHSPEFISTAHEDLNIVLVRKNKEKASEAVNTSFKLSKEKQILVKIQNSEMFFADKVILVEGGDKYILESIAKLYGRGVNPDLEENWLNDKNFSVIAVGGKTEFWKYYKKLKELRIKCYILADFDFFLRKLNEFMTKLGSPGKHLDELNGLKGKLGIPDFEFKKTVLAEIANFKQKLQNEGYTIDEKEIRSKLKDPFRVKRLNQLPVEYHQAIREYLDKMKKTGLYILEGELEDFYTESCKKLCHGVQGKEEVAIHIVSQLVTSERQINELVDCREFFSFLNLVTSEPKGKVTQE